MNYVPFLLLQYCYRFCCTIVTECAAIILTDFVADLLTDYNSPDLILLDIKMGKYNGLDICKELKSNSFTSYIPVLMLSSDQRSSDDISEYQADGIIIKPFQIADMIKQIGEFGGAKIIPLYRGY